MNMEDDKNTTNAVIAVVDKMCVFAKKYDCAVTCDLQLLRECAVNGVCKRLDIKVEPSDVLTPVGIKEAL